MVEEVIDCASSWSDAGDGNNSGGTGGCSHNSKMELVVGAI